MRKRKASQRLAKTKPLRPFSDVILMKIKCQLIVGTSRSTECICSVGKFNDEKAKRLPGCQCCHSQPANCEALLSDKTIAQRVPTSAVVAVVGNGESTNYQRGKRARK